MDSLVVLGEGGLSAEPEDSSEGEKIQEEFKVEKESTCENSRFLASSNLALVRSESGVDPTVTSERRRVGEGLLALLADVWALSGTSEAKTKMRTGVSKDSPQAE